MQVKDAFNLDKDRFPLTAKARYWEFELRAGELLLIPYDFPHQVSF